MYSLINDSEKSELGDRLLMFKGFHNYDNKKR